jgi:hypothetical protein
MAIDYSTARGQVRLLTSDIDESFLVWDDDALNGHLRLWGITPTATDASRATLKRVAADVLDATATSEALIAKVIRTQDLSTDGSKTATALRDHAERLRAQADADDDAAGGGFFDVVEFTPYPVTAEATEAAS